MGAYSAGIEGEGGEMAILADISASIAQWLATLQEALAALEAAGSGGPALGAKMSAGVYADAAAVELVAEEIGQGGGPILGFALKGDNIAGAGTLNVRLSFRDSDVESVEFALPGEPEDPEDAPEPGSIAAKATLRAEEVMTPQPPLLEGYKTYSVYIMANGSETFGADGGEALLNVALKPRVATQAVVSLILSHLDIAYSDGGGKEMLADADIAVSVAVTALKAYSRFDVNRDGAVTLVDVDIVRASLGAQRGQDGAWATERAGRCDFDGNGVIEIADLTCAIAKYELAVP
jgi:hypothetical protein